uniref:Uncharacterized protein n=1 Tax=Oryza meridionalis TaxID=40149 RepID=A0A0E0DQI7_9ORYZ
MGMVVFLAIVRMRAIREFAADLKNLMEVFKSGTLGTVFFSSYKVKEWFHWSSLRQELLAVSIKPYTPDENSCQGHTFFQAPAVRAPLGIFLKVWILTVEKILQLSEAIMIATVGVEGSALSFLIN